MGSNPATVTVLALHGELRAIRGDLDEEAGMKAKIWNGIKHGYPIAS